MEDLLPIVLNIMTLASILMLVSLGLAITYGLMDLINVAHGEFLTIGAYTIVVVEALGGNYWLGLTLAPLVGALVGIGLERSVIRFLYTRPLDMILATWGTSLIVRQVIQMMFGARMYSVLPPVDGSVSLLWANYPAYRLILIGITIISMLGVYLIFRFTPFGLDVRSVIQDRTMAEVLGIDTARVNMLAFAVGSALAALAGELVAPLSALVPDTGFSYLGKAFFVVILGGVGNIAGVAAGSAFVGGLETLFNYLIPVSFSQALVLILAIVTVRFRPQGLLPA
jgi:branched-chain amino acid transport system permease protein/urea transport system permease protein